MSNKLQTVKDQIEGAKSLKSLLSIDIVQSRFVANYEKTTGKKDGNRRFEQEVFNFLDMARENQAIANCDRFSQFAAIVRAGTTGLSLRDGQLYLVPMGKVLKTQIGAHGKRELLMRMESVKFVSEAQLVLEGDKFVYDRINLRVIEHSSELTKKLTKSIDKIIAVYCRLEYNDGRIIDTVLENEDLVKARNAAKTKAVWDAWPGEMAKKSVYNRMFKLYHRYSDNEIGDYPDYEIRSDEEPVQGAHTVEEVEEETTDTKSEPQEEATEETQSDISDAEVVEDKETPDQGPAGAF